jgi:hypothetical protein
MDYLKGMLSGRERILVGLVALVLVPVFFLPVLPIWHMKMKAPQYPEGLELVIYTNTIKGDVQKVNTLNHYVGMKEIRDEDFREFRFMPQALSVFGGLALVAALTRRRWFAVLGWVLFTAFAAVMFADFWKWLYAYGHDLNPRAAIKLEAFTPPVVGFKQMANFKVWSLPGVGTFLLGGAWLLGPVMALLARRLGDGARNGATRAA